MSQNIKEKIKDVFSIVADLDIGSLSEDVWKKYDENRTKLQEVIYWVEFERGNNKLIRCGYSKFSGMSTSLLSGPEKNTEIMSIVERTKMGDLREGDVEALPSRQSFFWVLPYKPYFDRDVMVSRTKVLLITAEAFFAAVDFFNENAQLTKAEKRVLFQIIMGLSLREAAKSDSVKIETKREQLKKVFRKLHCDSQLILTRTIFSQMVSFIFACDVDVEGIRVSEDFANSHFQGDWSYGLKKLQNGRTIRFFESGPLDGKPVLLIHGMLFLPALSGCQEKLKEHNIRLTIPIRPGYLEQFDNGVLIGDYNFTNQTIEDIGYFIKETFESGVNVLAHNLGGPIALQLGSRYPELVLKLLIVSTALPSRGFEKNLVFQSFLTGLQSLIQNKYMAEIIAQKMLKFTRTTQQLKANLTRIYRDCPSDLEALDVLVGDDYSHQWSAATYRCGIVGINEDYRFLLGNWRKNFSSVAVPIDFIHGDRSPTAPLNELEKLVSENDLARARIISDAGHLAIVSHPDQVWQCLSDSLTDS